MIMLTIILWVYSTFLQTKLIQHDGPVGLFLEHGINRRYFSSLAVRYVNDQNVDEARNGRSHDEPKTIFSL